MKKCTHTPGPWSADTGDYPIIVNGPDAESQIICIIEDPEDPTAATAESIDENDANAILIASAPDLLATLRTIAGLYGTSATNDDPHAALESIFAMASAAIAQAEGGE